MRTHWDSFWRGSSDGLPDDGAGSGRSGRLQPRRRLHRAQLEVRDHLGDGYNFNFGVQVNVSRAVAIEGLYSSTGWERSASRLLVLPTPLETSRCRTTSPPK